MRVLLEMAKHLKTGLQAELRNVKDMADISVQKNWKVGVKSLGEHLVLQNQVMFWVNLSNLYEILSLNQDYMIECSSFVFQK